MINIQTAQVIYYDPANEKSITVYQDFDFATNKKVYLVPIPELVTDSENNPVFSITEYVENEGSRGTCAFSVHLFPPQNNPQIKAAVQAALGPDIIYGQLDWVAVTPLFFYQLEGQAYTLEGSATMYDGNRATFVVELENESALNTFKGAFHKNDGTSSPFRIGYDVTALTKLVGVTATVSYNSEIAIEYSKKIETEKDTWGNEKVVNVEVTKHLQQSEAGNVEIDWNTTPSNEVRQRVENWAWKTLEDAVAVAVETANAAAEGDSPVDATYDFTQTYQENEVIEWIISPEGELPAYSDPEWAKVYTKVDNRELVINFSLLGDAEVSDPNNQTKFQRIEITVTYPTKTTNNVVILDSENPTEVYTAPGDLSGGSYNPEYSYTYKIIYENAQPYTDTVSPATATEVSFRASDYGVKSVTFVGSNIPFVDDVNFADSDPGGRRVTQLVIDFYFNRPDGEPNKVDQLTMTQNGIDGQLSFKSFYAVPIENEYSFRYTYQLEDSSLVVIDSTTGFGQENRNVLQVLNPFIEQTFSLKLKRTDGVFVQYCNVYASYVDDQNNFSENNSFDFEGEDKFMVTDTWTFNGTKSKSAQFVLKGEIYSSDGDKEIPVDLTLAAIPPMITFDPTQEMKSVTIDAKAVDWNLVSRVSVTVLQLSSGLGEAAITALADKFANNEKLTAEDGATNIVNFDFLAPEEGSEDYPVRYYTVKKTAGPGSYQFFWKATYGQKAGGDKQVDESEVTNSFLVTLPTNGTSDTPKLHQVTVPDPTAAPGVSADEEQEFTVKLIRSNAGYIRYCQVHASYHRYNSSTPVGEHIFEIANTDEVPIVGSIGSFPTRKEPGDYIELLGELINSNNKMIDVKLRTSPIPPFISFYADRESRSVLVDPVAVDWEKVRFVSITLFQLSTDGAAITDSGDPVNIANFLIQPPLDGAPPQVEYYQANKDLGAGNYVIYWQATYGQIRGGDNKTGTEQLVNTFLITLPADV